MTRTDCKINDRLLPVQSNWRGRAGVQALESVQSSSVGISRCLEENLLRHFGRETEASSALRRGFLSIWSEILRRVRRSNFANSPRTMQPTSRARWLVDGVKGSIHTLGYVRNDRLVPIPARG